MLSAILCSAVHVQLILSFIFLFIAAIVCIFVGSYVISRAAVLFFKTIFFFLPFCEERKNADEEREVL